MYQNKNALSQDVTERIIVIWYYEQVQSVNDFDKVAF